MSNLRTDNFCPNEAKSTRLPLEGEMHRSLITFIFEGRKISSFSCGGIKLICKNMFTKNIVTITFGEVPPSPNYAYDANEAIIVKKHYFCKHRGCTHLRPPSHN